MPDTKIKPELAEVVRKIRALRNVTKATGFVTNRTIGEMLAKLPVDDLVAVGEALQFKPGELKQIDAESGVRRYDPQGNPIRQ
jgi:hypothetical protein